jgi:hypothetical protein
MTGQDDLELARMHRMDPTLRSAPPAPGSLRYHQILEKAMTQMIDRQMTDTTPVRPRRRWAGWAAASGAAATAVGVTVAVLAGSSAPAAADVLKAAALHTSQATSLRFASTMPGGFTATGEVRGSDSRVIYIGEGGSQTMTVIGDRRYTTQNGKTSVERLAAGSRLAPFAASAADVVRAAVADGKATKIGNEKVRGVEATHYRLTLAERTGAAQPEPALAKLPKNELAWFDLEGVGSYSADVTVDVYVADGLIHRLGVIVAGQHGAGSSDDFFDFNAPITITPPAVS